MKKVILMASILIGQCLCAAAQIPDTSNQPTPANKDVANAEALVREWFNRLNALSSWFISVEGKEEFAEPVNKMVELYRPDVLQFVPPNEEQIGTVTFSGLNGVRQWAEQFARTYVELGFRIDPQSSGEKNATFFYTFAPPWNGAGVAVQFTALYTVRETRRRFFAPGAAFFEFQDGKIRRLRFFVAKDEASEVFR